MNATMDKTRALLDALGHDEEPLGIFYSDVEPEEGLTAKPGPPLSLEMEQRGEIDFGEVWKNFSCVMGKAWLARKQKKAAYLSAERHGCPGASFFLGFHKPQLDFICGYVSTGVPGAAEGERYLPSPESVRRFFTRLDPRPAPARYCVLKPLSLFSADETPELAAFFCRGEVLTGLCQLTWFLTDDVDAVAIPFGSGCGNLVTWPYHYQAWGLVRGVIGGADPSCRKYARPDELSFTVPWDLYLTMLDRWPETFLTTETWAGVRKKVLKSRAAWDKEPKAE